MRRLLLCAVALVVLAICLWLPVAYTNWTFRREQAALWADFGRSMSLMDDQALGSWVDECNTNGEYCSRLIGKSGREWLRSCGKMIGLAHDALEDERKLCLDTPRR